MMEKKDISFQLRMEKTISEIEKNQADLRKATSDALLSNKKIKWYEYIMILTGIGAVIAFTKLFL